MRDHFFIRNEVPYLAVIVSYRPQPVQAAVRLSLNSMLSPNSMLVVWFWFEPYCRVSSRPRP